MSFASLSKSFSVLSVVLATTNLGCSKSVLEHDRERLAAFQLKTAPKIPSKVDISYGGKVTLLGYKLEASALIRPKDKVKVTFYWRLDKKLEPGWRLSTRVLGERGEILLGADDIGPLRERRNRKQALSPSDWTVGTIYVDEQELTMPAELPAQVVRIAAALRKAEFSLDPESGEIDKRGYLTVAQLPVDVRRKAHTVAQLAVPMLAAGQTIEIDGKLDDAAWKSAAALPALVDMATGKPPAASKPFSARAKLLWDLRALYLAVEVVDSDLDNGFKGGAEEPPLWKRDSLELVVKLGNAADNRDYYRIAVGLQNQLFDSAYDDYRVSKSLATEPLGDIEWSSGVKFATSLSGTVDDAINEDEGYVQELSIPWASFTRPVPFLPIPGASLWMNFAVSSHGSQLGFVPLLGDTSLQVARNLGKLVLGPAGMEPEAPTQVTPLTLELPPSLIAAEAAERIAATAATISPKAAEGGRGASVASPAKPVADEGNKPAAPSEDRLEK